MTRAPLTAEIARQLLTYEPETGLLFWKERPPSMFRSELSCAWWNQEFAGKQAFNTNTGRGYLSGTIFDKTYLTHRIVWLIATGEWPTKFIDHANGNTRDNRLENLSDVDSVENARNQKRNTKNTSGVTGVYWQARTNNWMARIIINKRAKFLGHFKTLEEAAAARAEANRRYGFSERHGAPQ